MRQSGNVRAFIIAFVALLGAWIASRVWRGRFSFADKTVIISGGSRGLGLVLARQLCQEGAKVVLLARDQNELARAKSDLNGRGGEVLTLQCDVSDSAQINAAVDEALRRHGRIDVLINNAGIIEVGPLENINREDFERTMAIHFWAPLELIKAVLPSMRARRTGRIVNISSIGGKIAVPHLAPYSASKFALTGLSDALRAELAADGVSVTTVAPGMMRTGSHVNARFKGRHDAEFAWFSVASGAPFISMNAGRAARKILAACRRGQPSLTLTFAARGLVVANAMFPNLTGYVMKTVSRFLPNPLESGDGDQFKAGHETRRLAPGWMTSLSDRATKRNNERG